jgi:hypothetical protein
MRDANLPLGDAPRGAIDTGVGLAMTVCPPRGIVELGHRREGRAHKACRKLSRNLTSSRTAENRIERLPNARGLNSIRPGTSQRPRRRPELVEQILAGHGAPQRFGVGTTETTVC